MFFKTLGFGERVGGCCVWVKKEGAVGRQQAVNDKAWPLKRPLFLLTDLLSFVQAPFALFAAAARDAAACTPHLSLRERLIVSSPLSQLKWLSSAA
ncbi:MAG: hypothetical protein KJ063_06575 [Anaerolineae bacterium]|nr:hypothetical protein [Anaerolineae bacterium]